MADESEKNKEININNDEISTAHQFGRDRMVLPGVDLSCCELPENPNGMNEVTACGIEVEDDEDTDYEEF